ncbi:MAG: cell wall hydrolase [Lachnospiraceae bacterium]|nr:cell wall hydrolase [Lachnospiraceae bacterium]
MYKKYMTLLLLGNFIILGALFCVRGLEVNRLLATEAFRLNLEEATSTYDMTRQQNMGQVAASGQRVVSYDLLEQERLYQLCEEDYNVLLRIVEAEAGGEDENGKLLVANVILNRVKSEDFPDTIEDVVFQNDGQTWQFSPVSNGRYYAVNVSEETVCAVERALMGEDISEGALYFASRKHANPEKMNWFDQRLEFLFSYGGHEFFK